MVYSRYQQNGFDSPMIMGVFRGFLAKKYLKGEFRSFEAWCDIRDGKI